MALTYDEILRAIEQLTADEQDDLLRKLTRLIDWRPSWTEPRKSNLAPGSMTTSDDFDDPLPDEFWEGGSDDPLVHG